MNVGWSDEFHFPVTGVAKTKRMTRKKGERYDDECVQKVARTSKMRKKRQKELGETPDQIHCWVFLHQEGREIALYQVGNDTGKMNSKCYNEQCLTHVLPLLKEKELWLQEDNDGSYDSNKIVAFKRKHNIRAFQTPGGSPDLSVAEFFA